MIRDRGTNGPAMGPRPAHATQSSPDARAGALLLNIGIDARQLVCIIQEVIRHHTRKAKGMANAPDFDKCEREDVVSYIEGYTEDIGEAFIQINNDTCPRDFMLRIVKALHEFRGVMQDVAKYHKDIPDDASPNSPGYREAMQIRTYGTKPRGAW